MNQFRLFLRNSSSISLFTVALTLASSIPTLTVNAQPSSTKTEIAQALSPSQEQKITKHAEKFVEALGNKNYQQALSLLPPRLQKFWTTEQVQKIWETDLISRFGPYKKIVSSKVIDVINGDVVRVTTQFAKGTEDILVTFDKQQEPIAVNWSSGKSIDTLATAFVNALATGDYARARTDLSPLLKVEFFPENIQKGWENLIKRTGPYQKQLGVTQQVSGFSNAPDVAIVKVQFEKRTDNVFIFFNKNRQIVNVDFPE